MSCRSGNGATDAAASLTVRQCLRQRDDLLGKSRSSPSTVRTESAVILGLCPEQYDCMLEGADQASVRSTLQRTSCSRGEANRRNARLSTGPTTEEGKKKSRRNAIRHRLTAETVIDALEDAEDYAAFEMAVTSDYDARTAVERELVLRLASLLWRLRRATAIESGLFRIQAEHFLQFRHRRRTAKSQKSIDNLCRFAGFSESGDQANCDSSVRAENWTQLGAEPVVQADDLTLSFVRLSNLPSYPLDRLSRYEATLWRQACQILFTLRCLQMARP